MHNDNEMSASFDIEEITGSFAREGVAAEIVEAPHVELSECDNGGLDSWGDL